MQYKKIKDILIYIIIYSPIPLQDNISKAINQMILPYNDKYANRFKIIDQMDYDVICKSI